MSRIKGTNGCKEMTWSFIILRYQKVAMVYGPTVNKTDISYNTTDAKTNTKILIFQCLSLKKKAITGMKPDTAAMHGPDSLVRFGD